MGKKNENFRKNKFRLRSKYILLTYSQTPPDFDPLAINLCVKMLGGLARIGKETHPNTGGDHYHCFAAHPTKFQTRSHRSFDVQGIHPNIQPVQQTPWTPWHYAVKDGNIIVDDVPEPPRGRGRKSKTEDQARRNPESSCSHTTTSVPMATASTSRPPRSNTSHRPSSVTSNSTQNSNNISTITSPPTPPPKPVQQVLSLAPTPTPQEKMDILWKDPPGRPGRR